MVSICFLREMCGLRGSAAAFCARKMHPSVAQIMDTKSRLFSINNGDFITPLFDAVSAIRGTWKQDPSPVRAPRLCGRGRPQLHLLMPMRELERASRLYMEPRQPFTGT